MPRGVSPDYSLMHRLAIRSAVAVRLNPLKDIKAAFPLPAQKLPLEVFQIVRLGLGRLSPAPARRRAKLATSEGLPRWHRLRCRLLRPPTRRWFRWSGGGMENQNQPFRGFDRRRQLLHIEIAPQAPWFAIICAPRATCVV